MRRIRAVLAAGALAVAGTVLPAAPAPAVGDPPSLSVAPTCTDGNPAPVLLHATGLPGELPFRVLLVTGTDPAATVLEGNTGAVGAFNRTATLPAIPVEHFSLLAVQVWHADGSSGAWSGDLARALVRVCPTLLADPAEVEVGSLPRPVTVTGAGWDARRAVQLSVDGAPGPAVIPDRSGRFVTDVQLPVRPCGPVLVTGVQQPPPPILSSIAVPPPPGEPLEASTTIAVVCPPPSTPPTTPPTPSTPSTPPSTTPPTAPPPATTPVAPVPPAPDARLTVDAVLASGGVGTARGAGFVPGRPVTLHWQLADGSPAPGSTSAMADAAGRFTVPCLVLPRAVLGSRVLQARQQTPEGVRAAAATTLVVGGPMEPGRNRLLGRR